MCGVVTKMELGVCMAIRSVRIGVSDLQWVRGYCEFGGIRDGRYHGADFVCME